MANYKSDLVTKQEAAVTQQSQGLRDGDDVAGVLLYATAVVTLTGAVATDTVQLVDLPAGAVVVPQLSHVTCGAAGATVKLDIGDAADTDRYADDLVLTAGGQVAFCSGATLPAAAAAPFRLISPSRVYGTLSTVTGTITAGWKVTVTVAYRVKG